jgi:AAA+ superfamily predicted ATPase
LDKALWRRFDLTLEFHKPSSDELRAFVSKKIEKFHTKLSKLEVRSFVKAESYAEAEKNVESVVRQLALRKIERRSWQKRKPK